MSELEQLAQAFKDASKKLEATPEWKAFKDAGQVCDAVWQKLKATPEYKAYEDAWKAYDAAKVKAEENND